MYCFCPRKKEALQHTRQERGKCTQCMPVYKVSTFQREGPSILLYTPWSYLLLCLLPQDIHILSWSFPVASGSWTALWLKVRKKIIIMDCLGFGANSNIPRKLFRYYNIDYPLKVPKHENLRNCFSHHPIPHCSETLEYGKKLIFILIWLPVNVLLTFFSLLVCTKYALWKFYYEQGFDLRLIFLFIS